ncbi:Ankyrin repeat domain-containing protein 27 [Geodia barretti]|nr:Ankyrin repeat domain-containing protein 27 [Geodia barretti]
MHMLQPSVYLKDQYTAVCNGQRLDWQLRGGQLDCVSSSGTSLSIQVLSEELAYNRQLQQFKMFIVDRPLDPNYKPSGVRGSHYFATKTRRKFEEHVHFLKSFENHREPLRDLDNRVSGFLQHYLIVEQENLLGETASKLGSTTKQAHASFLEANRRDGRLEDRRVHEAVWLSMESYLMEKVHSKVFPALCRVHKRQNDDLVQRSKYLRGTLTPSGVGVSEDYNCPYGQTLLHLNQLESFKSPLEQLYCLQDAMECIQQDAREHFTKTLRHGEPTPLASDDLIALLATILTQSNCVHLFSCLYYMEHFHWPPSDTDRLSYVLVTFHAAMEYIRGPDVTHLLPKNTVLSTGALLSRDRRTENHRERSLSPCPPSPVSSSSLSTLTESTPSLDGARDDKTLLPPSSLSPGRRGHKKPPVKHTELGPFLSLLVESEETISSTSWDPYS